MSWTRTIVFAVVATTGLGATTGEVDMQPPTATTVSDTSEPTSSEPGDRFRAAVENRDADAIAGLLANDIELYTPALPDPFVGKPTVSRLFGVLVTVFEDIAVQDTFRDGASKFVLVFSARVGTEDVLVVDLITFDGDGLISEFVVTMRPIAGIQALAEAVAPHLGEILGG